MRLMKTRVQMLKNKDFRRLRSKLQVMLLLILCLTFSGCAKEKNQDPILIGAAASLKPVMEELQTMYAKEYPKAPITFTFAGSGALEQQIREGAPVDLFISAAEKQMNALEEDDLIIDSSKVNLLKNELVLIVPKDSSLDMNKFEDITKVKMIGLGDPSSVPVGQYAMEVFDYLGITEAVEGKATYGKDVTEVLNWVSSGNVDAGIVYATDAINNSDVKIVAYATEESHAEIIYPAAVVKESKYADAAQNFLDFLGTEKAKQIFIDYGFQVIE